jgi:hypothetical protein
MHSALSHPGWPLSSKMLVAYAAWRQGWAATPAPPARDFVPWNPDSMLSYAKLSSAHAYGQIWAGGERLHVLAYQSHEPMP